MKSRYQTDSDRAFPVKDKTFESFDYLMMVFLNIEYFFARSGKDGGVQQPEIFTVPRKIVEELHYKPKSGFQKIRTKGKDLVLYKDALGIEQIAKDLHIPYPSREV